MSDSLGGVLDLKSRLNKAMDSVEEHQRKLAEKKEKLKVQQAQYYRLLNALHEVYYSADMQGNITDISPSIGEVAGYDCEEIIGKPATFFYKYAKDRQVMLETLQKQGFIVDYELELVHHDGSSLYASLNVHVITDEQGKPSGVEGLLRDITERVALEDQLRETNKSLEARVSERTAELEARNMQLSREIKVRQQAEHRLMLLSTAISAAAEGVIITDPRGSIEYVNSAFVDINGYTEDEVMGKNMSMLSSGEHDVKFIQHFWTTVSSGQTWEGTFTNKRKDGHCYQALMSVSPVKDAMGELTHYVAIQQDMTEQHLLDAKFRQAQKMDALGTLVGGIAHDFNNTLSGMLMHLYLAKKAVSQTLPDVADRLQQVEALGQSASEMLKQLMAFARQDQIRMKPLSLNGFLKDGLRLVQVSVPENILIETDILDEELCVNGDRTQLQQILINLLNNARDALEGVENPRIDIRLTRKPMDKGLSRVHPELTKLESLACLSVKDSGCGMSAEDKSCIFDPFFTTKQEGKGNGLGLAMVYGAVQQHGGVVEVESEIGSGTIFHIYFPLHEQHQRSDEVEVNPLMEGQGEKILLVDDDDMVRSITSDLLESLGYRVTQAKDGLDAVACFKDQADISLVIMDVVMPKMGGVDAAFKLREQQADLPIIFMSGYDQEQAVSMKAMQGAVSLPKPLIPVTLSQCMRTLLDKPS